MKQNQYLGNKTGWWYGLLWGSRKVTWIIMDFTSHLWLCDCFYLVLCTTCDTLSITNDFVVVFLMNFVQSVILYVSLMTFWLFFFSIYVQSVIPYLSLMTLWLFFLWILYKVWYSMYHLWLCGLFPSVWCTKCDILSITYDCVVCFPSVWCTKCDILSSTYDFVVCFPSVWCTKCDI